MVSMDTLLHLTRLSLAFGRENRATMHPDGVTRESDTDHTVMLALVAPALAARLRPDLQPALVAAFAVVHDLPEVYAGDTNTLNLSAVERANKTQRELAALNRLDVELSELPWIAGMMHRYEEQDAPEARWVRYVDKILPKLTHALNGGVSVSVSPQGQQLSPDARAGIIRRSGDCQCEELAEAYPEFPELLELLRASIDQAERAAYDAWVNDVAGV